MFLPSAERTRIQAVLAEKLAGVPIGGQISYSEIKVLTGLGPVAARPVLYAAFKDLNEQSGAIFSNVREVGYQRVTQEQAPEIGRAARQSIGRKARRAAKELSNFSARSNGLPAEIAEKVNREIAISGLIEYAASGRSIKTLQDVAASDHPPSLADTGRALLGKLGAA